MKSLSRALLLLSIFAWTHLIAAPGDYAGTYTGYWSMQPDSATGLSEVVSKFVTLVVNDAGRATMNTVYGSRTAMVNANGGLSLSDDYWTASFKIARVGKTNTGVSGTGMLYSYFGFPTRFILSLQNVKAAALAKITPALAVGNYNFMARGDVDYGYANRVGAGTLTLGAKSWSGSITIAHMTVPLGGTVEKDGSLKIVRPAKYATGKFTIAPFAVGTTYIGFRGRFKDRLNGVQLDLIGVKSK